MINNDATKSAMDAVQSVYDDARRSASEAAYFNTQAAQGELLVEYIDSLPEDVQEIAPDGDHVVVGHSETGHHHVMSTARVRHFRDTKNPMTTYLLINEPDELRHLRSFDTHRSISFLPGVVRVDHQREGEFDEWRQAAD